MWPTAAGAGGRDARGRRLLVALREVARCRVASERDAVCFVDHEEVGHLVRAKGARVFVSVDTDAPAPELAEAELRLELFLPLPNKRARDEDENDGSGSVDKPLADDETGLDRLAEAHLVGEQVALHGVGEYAPGDRDLVGVEIDGR